MAATPSPEAPRGSCFVRSRNGYFTYDRAFKPPTAERRLACFNGYFTSLEVFDAGGRRWRIAEVDTPHKTHFLAKILAHTVYNPTMEVRVHWAPPVPYTIDELRAAYIQAVERDDDILTQFAEREELLPRIQAAADFDALVKVYRWAKTERD